MINDPDVEIFRQKLIYFGGWSHFWTLSGLKKWFLHFFKVVFEFFRECLDVIFRLIRPTLGCISA